GHLAGNGEKGAGKGFHGGSLLSKAFLQVSDVHMELAHLLSWGGHRSIHGLDSFHPPVPLLGFGQGWLRFWRFELRHAQQVAAGEQRDDQQRTGHITECCSLKALSHKPWSVLS